MRPLVPLLASIALLGCTAQTDGSAPASAGATQTTAAVGEQIACIDATRIAGKRAENNRTLVIETSGGQVYRNDLQEACPGIERASSFGTLAIDPIETRLCRNDMVRIYDPSDVPSGGLKSVPRCRLGAFTRLADRTP